MANNTLIGALRAEATLESGKFVDGARKLELSAKKTESQLKRSFGSMGASVKQFGASLVAGLSVGLITQGIRASLDYAASLGEVAQQLGVTSRELQVFRYAAQQNGASVEQADQALGKLSLSISKALAGSKQATAAFAAMGVSLDDLRNKSKTELVGQIADGMKRAGGASANAAAGVTIFGKGFQKIVPLLDQGSAGFNAAAQAAEELGVVLDDDLIQSADVTADKLDALMTVLKTQIASEVAQSAGAIIELANALMQVANAMRIARAELVKFQLQGNNAMPWTSSKKRAANRAGIFRQNLELQQLRGEITTRPIGGIGSSKVGAGVPEFLGGGGGRRGGGKDDAERKRKEALREAHQFDQELLRAQMDVIRAQQQLATDYTARANLGIELLNLEQLSFDREMEYAIASGELTKAQAAQLKAEHDKKDALERQAIREEEEAQRLEDYNRLDILDLELRRDELQSQAQLAETASEQRDLRLRLLDLDYRIERARLEQVLADEKASFLAKEDARRRLVSLNKAQPRDQQAVIAGTRGPLEDYMSGLPSTAEKWNEALEMVAANGLKSLEDGLVAIITGAESVGEAFKKMAASIIADLIRIQIQKMIVNLLGSIGGGSIDTGFGSVGFASGGWTGAIGKNRVAGFVHGQEYVLNAEATRRIGVPNLEAMNRGAPMSSVSNDNSAFGSTPAIPPFIFNNYAKMTPAEARQTGMQAAAGWRQKIAEANRKGY